jgi:hypothetical protein
LGATVLGRRSRCRRRFGSHPQRHNRTSCIGAI